MGFDEGYAFGKELAAHRQDRKEQLSDEQHAIKRDDLLKTKDTLQAQLANYKDANGNVIPEFKDQHDKTLAALSQNQYEFGQLYDPIKAPGKLQQDWHYLREKIHGIKAPKTTNSFTSQGSAVTLPSSTPAPITTPELPAYQQTDISGLPSQGGTATTTEVPGVAATTMPGMQGAPLTMPAPPPVTVTKAPAPTWGQAQLLKKQAAAMQKAQQEAKTLEAGAGLSPEQTATVNANATNAGSLATIRGQIKNYKTLNPNATDEDVAAYASTLMPGNNQIGNWEVMEGTIDGQSYPLSYDRKKALYKLPDGSFSSTRPENWKASPKATGVAAQDLNDYNNDPDPKKGTFAEWKARQTGIGRNAVIAAKPPNRDDKYIAILQKQTQGQPLTPDELAYKGAYDLWVQQTKVLPGVARMAALNDDRYTWVYDLNDPDKSLKPMRMKDAAKAPVGTPQNIAFKTDTAITRAFTSGAPAQTINYFNTAIEHLKLLQQAVDALNNGDVQLFNSIANRYATATGNPAPNNFDTVRNAVSGELSKTFKGTGATDEEIGLISGTINNAQSPDQLYGGIDYDLRLMQGKMQALQGQYEAGKQGRPNFPGTTPSQGGGNGTRKGSRSLAAAMALPINKGKSADEVQKHLESLGYIVTKP